MKYDLIERPKRVNSPVISRIVRDMNRMGRPDLVHYASASWRDEVAWLMVGEWYRDPTASEAVLKKRVLASL